MDSAQVTNGIGLAGEQNHSIQMYANSKGVAYLKRNVVLMTNDRQLDLSTQRLSSSVILGIFPFQTAHIMVSVDTNFFFTVKNILWNKTFSFMCSS